MLGYIFRRPAKKAFVGVAKCGFLVEMLSTEITFYRIKNINNQS
jgi:hypothetical protein